MKKLLFATAVLAAMIMTGCSNDQEVPGGNPGSKEAVGFSMITQKGRATETNSNNIRDFKVYGRWEGTDVSSAFFDFMYGINVVRTGGVWEYSPLSYWPTQGNVDFYSFSPAGSHGVTTFAKTAVEPRITYEVSNVDDMQEDFLVSAATAQNKSTNSGIVKFSFQHALSQVIFEARSGLEGVIFTIEDITLTNMAAKGELSLANIAGGWSVDNTPIKNYPAPIKPLPVVFNTNSYTTLSGPNDGLMLMPQVVEAGSGVINTGETEPEDIADKHYLIITYSASLTSGAEFVASGTQIYVPLDMVPGGKFEMGKKYIFQLTMTAELEPIRFEVEVSPWIVAS